MADLGVGGASGMSRSNNGGTRLAPGGSEQPPRVMTPSDIMARRRERELKKAEEEARRRAEEQRRLSAERRAVAAGVAGGGSGSRRSTERPEESGTRNSQRGSGGSTKQQIEENTPTRAGPGEPGASLRLSGDSGIPQPAASSRSRAQSVTQQGQPRPVMPTTTRAPAVSNPQTTSQPRQTATTATAGPDRDPFVTAKPQNSQSTSQTRNGNTSSFPHAFERWEQLSSHWEGLTNYWIKRLESNSQEIKNQPINQQLARQVTDLSAAGANLFHAVVELQRLRASSERKFQRWFFETRSEQERTQDKIAKLEAELEAEREARKSDDRNGSRVSADNSKIEEAMAYKRRADEQMREMRRELQISRDEARRGWEEIGRMEQAERDRTYSLKRGQPTLVGGVQVVPMPQGSGSRQASSSRERPTKRAGDPGEQQDGRTAYANYDEVRSEADTDPYVEGPVSSTRLDAPLPSVPSARQAQAQAYPTSTTSSAAVQAARTVMVPQSSPQRPVVVSSASRTSPGRYEQQAVTSQPTSQPFYQQHGSGTALHEDMIGRTNEPDDRSDVRSDAFSEEEYEIDEHGRIRRDAYGNPIPYRSEEELRRRQRYAEEAQHGMTTGGPPAPMPPTSGAYPPSSNGGHPAYAAEPDYSGEGYGDEYGAWGNVPRHHHPTRLSDVLEEDERSRTSPSRASERSRGFN